MAIGKSIIATPHMLPVHMVAFATKHRDIVARHVFPCTAIPQHNGLTRPRDLSKGPSQIVSSTRWIQIIPWVGEHSVIRTRAAAAIRCVIGKGATISPTLSHAALSFLKAAHSEYQSVS